MAHGSIDRSRRVGGLIQRELSELIVSELGDPRVGGVTITDVRVGKDLRQAVIYVSRLDEAASKDGAAKSDGNHEYVDVLNSAAGVLRRHLGRRLSTRVTPSLEFRYDETLAHGFKMSKLIEDSRSADGPEPGAEDEQ